MYRIEITSSSEVKGQQLPFSCEMTAENEHHCKTIIKLFPESKIKIFVENKLIKEVN